MATHSSVLAWRIPGMVEPGGLRSMGSHRVGHDWSDLAAAAAVDILQILHSDIPQRGWGLIYLFLYCWTLISLRFKITVIMNVLTINIKMNIERYKYKLFSLAYVHLWLWVQFYNWHFTSKDMGILILRDTIKWVCSVMSDSTIPWTTQSVEFSRPEYWRDTIRFTSKMIYNIKTIKMTLIQSTEFVLLLLLSRFSCVRLCATP